MGLHSTVITYWCRGLRERKGISYLGTHIKCEVSSYWNINIMGKEKDEMSKYYKTLLLLGSHQFSWFPLSCLLLPLTSRAWFWFYIWVSNPHFICLIDPSTWTSYHQLNLRMSETKLSSFFSKSLIPLDQWYSHSCHSILRPDKPYCFFLQNGYCIHILLSVLIVTDSVYTISAYIWIILNNF